MRLKLEDWFDKHVAELVAKSTYKPNKYYRVSIKQVRTRIINNLPAVLELCKKKQYLGSAELLTALQLVNHAGAIPALYALGLPRPFIDKTQHNRHLYDAGVVATVFTKIAEEFHDQYYRHLCR